MTCVTLSVPAVQFEAMLTDATPQHHFMHGTNAKAKGSIRLPSRKAQGWKAYANMQHGAQEHILSMCNVGMPNPL